MTPNQLEGFRSEGHLTLPGRITAEDLVRLRAEADAILRSVPLTDRRMTAWRLADGDAYVLKAKPVLDLAPTAQTLAVTLSGLASALLGDDARLIDEKISYKQRLTGTAPDRILGEDVRKHTDAAYYRLRGITEPIVTIAVCLDDCPPSAGPVRVWPGSHLHDVTHEITEDHGPVVSDRDAPDEHSVLLTAEARAVLVWDARLVHASTSNTSGRPRRLLILGYAL
ncbi:phytanoyl-CoA dioxygenase family protein [Actinocorallia sp. API 0066]|uniref:phytanoyl-CoA dioxygenase family protein n=1 Tax=Actinocorallia sp. API 0066 TaxID=2896846 RepID=UPI001E2AD171|nr:phytanoyl-CoA dioxygenase family protein [Actinocorallia sp. API 0066]MCD0452496.1 phytanoyl-CoA dioxygenase family protein [Actinocorallia sp. API 0066]